MTSDTSPATPRDAERIVEIETLGGAHRFAPVPGKLPHFTARIVASIQAIYAMEALGP